MINNVKKNLLDLTYNKYMQYLNTVIILIFTYLMGILIAFFTNQISYENKAHLLVFFILSVLILGVNVVFIINIRNKMKNIFEEIKNL